MIERGARREIVPFELRFGKPCAGCDFNRDVRGDARLLCAREIRRDGRLRPGLRRNKRVNLGQGGGCWQWLSPCCLSASDTQNCFTCGLRRNRSGACAFTGD
jgi:hypothetical protein